MVTDSTDGKQIKSLNTGFDIIETIKETSGMTVTELAEELEYSKSTIHYYLQTLESRRYVVKEKQGTYRLGLRFFTLGNKALEHRDPPTFVKREVDTLAEETGLTALLAMEEEGAIVYVYRASTADETPDASRLGTEQPLHCTAFGKAILTHLPEDVRSNYINQHRLEAVTDATVTDPERLRSDLRAVRDRGLAIDDGEYRQGIRTIAAPVKVDTDTLLGAVGLVGETEQLDEPPKHAKAQRFTDMPSNNVKRTAKVIRSKFQDR